ncbi:MAG: carbamate kinase [Acidimicrobiia bacterium]
MVIAVGGNALQPRGERFDASRQRERALEAARALAPLLTRRPAVITHGNGPQVGYLLEHLAPGHEGDAAMDTAGAESEGLIGYVLEQAVENAVPGASVVTLLTQTVVDADDPAFLHPTKPIGAVLDAATAQRLHRERGWAVRPDGEGWRRVVASPEPVEIVEIRAIQALLHDGFHVVCAGGGGIPVVVDAAGRLHGANAVVDKDLTASLLACRLRADALVLLTDVDAVYRDWGTDIARPVRSMSVAEARATAWAAGSMGPKIEACCRFVEAMPHRVAVIGALDDAAAVVDTAAGTRIVP